MPLSDTLRATLERSLQGGVLDPVQRSVIEQTLASDLGGADVFDPAVQQEIATATGETRFKPTAGTTEAGPAAAPAPAPAPTPAPAPALAPAPAPAPVPRDVFGSTTVTRDPTSGNISGDFSGDPAGMAAFLLSLGHDPATVQSVINTQFGGAGAATSQAAGGFQQRPLAESAEELRARLRAIGGEEPVPTGQFGGFQQAPGPIGGIDALLARLRETGFEEGGAQIGRPGQFGFAPGAVPGGDALQFLRDIGFPIPSTFSGLQTGQPLRAGDLGTASQLLGGIGIPSPQSLGRLDNTGLQLLQSIFETLLGIPFGDVVTAGRRPFQGLRSAPQGRTGLLG